MTSNWTHLIWYLYTDLQGIHTFISFPYNPYSRNIISFAAFPKLKHPWPHKKRKNIHNTKDGENRFSYTYSGSVKMAFQWTVWWWCTYQSWIHYIPKMNTYVHQKTCIRFIGTICNSSEEKAQSPMMVRLMKCYLFI